MTTQLELYNGALLKVRERPISSLASADPSRLALDQVYSRTIQFVLEAGNWSFACRSVALQPMVGVTPSYGFTNVFEAPDDFVKLISISFAERGWPGLTANEYVFEATGGVMCFEADCTVLFISYVSSDTLYGGNLANWTATFCDAVEYELALRVAPQLTNLSVQELEMLKHDRSEAMKNARAKNAANDPSMMPPPGKLILSRMAYGSGIRWMVR